MIERSPLLDAATQIILVLALVLLLLPFWIIIAAASHDFHTVNQVPMPLWPGNQLWANLQEVWVAGNFG